MDKLPKMTTKATMPNKIVSGEKFIYSISQDTNKGWKRSSGPTLWSGAEESVHLCDVHLFIENCPKCLVNFFHIGDNVCWYNG